MSLNDTTSPAGYIDLLSQINPQSLTGFDPNIGSSQAQMFHLRDPMASSPLLFQDSLHSLLENDRLACKDSDTSLVAQLKWQLTESQHTVASLQADRLRLINENAGLNSTCQALQNVIVNIRGSASSVASTSSSLSACDTSNIISDDQKPLLVGEIVAEECDQELDRKDYPSIRSWTKKEWQVQYPKSTSAEPESSRCTSRGSGCMAQGINVSCTYLQDEKGEPVSADRAKSIRNHMLSSFQQLQSQGLAPVSIGQASLQVLRWLIHTLRKEYIEFRLCADNWKAMKLMTDNYSQWSTYHVKGKKASKRVKAEPGDELEVEHTKKRARINSDIISEPVTEPSTSTNEAIPDTLRHPSLDREPTPPPSTNKGKGKEVPIVEIKNPLSNLLMKPQPRPVPPKLPPTSIDSSTSIVSSSSESNPAVVLPSHIITPVSMTDISSSSNSTSLADLASLAVKMELVNANTIDSKADAIKKRQPSTKPMRVSPKIMARNLCALEWQSNGHQKEPASVFATYWNRLSTADKELYKCKAAVQLSAPGLAQADDNQDE
ncbi:uncharacterized protein BJ212DRAFT_1488461 [Suillus subaureus]|uniref:Uncharacterized protein n=1 Tax=Suillus subaureus TaxID=48587 RepID=A0A9P7DND2_9AGAM|nr:uncharacterized protein BJ212DRAFT_1488461 [Suillus subaureus]KAG1799079.1 hypothetical protein BJ212DRAFT_1488461 [Suillus subaureus]